MKRTPSIAIIGAGLTGLTVARRLADAGLNPRVYDKGRGIGGRLATRRTDTGESFDHGAPFVTAGEAPFRTLLTDLVDNQAAAVWGPTGPWRGRKPWHVGVPGMSSLPRKLAEGLEVAKQSEVNALIRNGDAWSLEFTKDRAPEEADIVVVAVPAPQAAKLLSPMSFAEQLTEVEMAPCLSLMVAFDRPLGLLFDALKAPSEDLAWVIRNSSKPGRLRLPEAWVAHASPEWSQMHLELERPTIADAMFQLLPEAMEIDLPEPTHLAGHRWRYALTTKPLGKAHLAEPDLGLYVGGDWCLGSTAEDAWKSGSALATDLLAAL
ncbi:MAG: FAD-dependent oxidoreductase [Pseudomonadota bacterium]